MSELHLNRLQPHFVRKYRVLNGEGNRLTLFNNWEAHSSSHIYIDNVKGFYKVMEDLNITNPVKL